MEVLGYTQYAIVWVLTLAAFGLEVFAFVDALRHRPDAYAAAGKRTKTFWLALTGVAMLVGILGIGGAGGLGLLGFVGVIVAGVYLADVRPALREVMGNSGGGGRMGPYGPW